MFKLITNETKEIHAVIFDLDGTLINSMWVWDKINVKFLSKRNLVWDDSLYREDMEGMSFTETAEYFKETFDLTESIEEIKEEWIILTKGFYTDEVELKNGVIEFLDLMRDKGIPLAIATSNSRELAYAVLDRYSLRDRFKAIVTSCEVNRGKPFPDVYLKAAEMLGVKPQDCIVFEDVIAGIKAAKSAGMTAFAVEDEYSNQYLEDLIEISDAYIKDFQSVNNSIMYDGKELIIDLKPYML